MQLSERAKAFLAVRKRRPSITDRGQIVAALERAHLPVFEPVIAFQQNYGGHTLYAYHEPLVFGILHPNPRGLKPNEVTGGQEEGAWRFDCVDTLYQMTFTLDELGAYYENGELVASSMGKLVENFAMWEELSKAPDWKPTEIGASVRVGVEADLSRLGLRLVPEASDVFLRWWIGETLCIQSGYYGLRAWTKTLRGERLLQKLNSGFL